MLPRKGEPRFSSQYYKPTRERKVPSHLLFYEGCLMKEGGLNLKGSSGLPAGAGLPFGSWTAGGFPGCTKGLRGSRTTGFRLFPGGRFGMAFLAPSLALFCWAPGAGCLFIPPGNASGTVATG